MDAAIANIPADASGIVSIASGVKIALSLTGSQRAGENLADDQCVPV